DLLKAEEYRRYLQNPEVLRTELAAGTMPAQIVIDEVQKVPQLLDEVHWLHEHRGARFALCGSSARKVKRGHANLLGGRAVRYELFGLTVTEIGAGFELTRMMNHGYLPNIYLSDSPLRLLNGYVADYLKEEVAAEGLVRSLPSFSEFLNIAALSDAELVNFSTIARDCGVSSHTVKAYFQILEDTLLAKWLPAFRKRPKRRVIGAPKFYFADVGVVNYLARRGQLQPGSELFGKAFENWVFHELSAYNAYQEKFATLSYWRLASGIEVDFIVNDMELAIEAKATARVTSDHLKNLRSLVDDQPQVKQRVVICLESQSRKTEDGILILSANDFCQRLATGDLF
ncbi:MAG: ATP-binding protein, partial [Deltaproteobacteria bacterium]|nr:ATP-binding protein [Deltaproteobacteria bacterium]